MSVAILGAGAFGTALALGLGGDGQTVTLWARDADRAATMATARENAARLPGHRFPETVTPTADLDAACRADILLLALPMQQVSHFLSAHGRLVAAKPLVACCKGLDLATGRSPHELICDLVPDARPALLSGPGFAIDIAAGLPTAMTLAAPTEEAAQALQRALSTASLRLYRSTDLSGVALGGALKNVVAIACGMAMGAGLGDSARAALLTRGFAEMRRFALSHGARPETLTGLSGLGDLVLTATSPKSRNYAFGLDVGRTGPQAPGATTEGIATARAVAALARSRAIEMPVAATVVAVLDGAATVAEATGDLLSRPLTVE